MRKPGRNAPRWVHALYALTHSYFWLPCPICRRKFGGHEESGSLAIGMWSGTSVCINCADEAEQRNQPIYDQVRATPMYMGPSGRTYYSEADMRQQEGLA